MKFINWFKRSLEDEKGEASFRRIYNWVLTMLIVYIVIWHGFKGNLTQLIISELLILLAAVFLNTSVITVDNVLRFFGRGDNKTDNTEKHPDLPQAPVTKITTTVETPPNQ